MPLELTPMLASPSSNSDAEFRQLITTGDWAADVKLDGVRCWVHWNGAIVTLLNRNGVNTTRKFPEVVAALSEHLAGERPCVVDGEIVSLDGLFETTLTRDKQTQFRIIEAMSSSRPCRFYGFDLPNERGDWAERRRLLVQLAVPVTVLSEDAGFFAQTRELGLEGVIAKRRNGRYEFGKRSRSWVKYKVLHRVTCLVAGYEPGNGSRAHFGAMHLALLDPSGQPVSVGRVGTGFDAKEILWLKSEIDAGHVLVVEIECANRTSTSQLRFASYKGVRTDVDPTSCTIAQLQQLPGC